MIDSLLGWPALGIIPLGKNIGCIMEVENVEGKKEPVKCGGECIYCGSDGGEFGLGHEHIVPYSLNGADLPGGPHHSNVDALMLPICFLPESGW